MSTHNIGFYEDLTKIIFQLSSNTHLISSWITKGLNHLGMGAAKLLFTQNTAILHDDLKTNYLDNLITNKAMLV